jgi:hypothetical protein
MVCRGWGSLSIKLFAVTLVPDRIVLCGILGYVALSVTTRCSSDER